MALDQYDQMDHLGFIGQADWLSERRGTMAGITEELQREIDVWCSPEARGWITPAEMVARDKVHSINGLPTKFHYHEALDPRQTEIANLKGELESARYEAAHARNLAVIVKAERDAALYERNIALQSLAELIQHFMFPPAPAPAEEDPAVRAVRVMQGQGIR